MKCKVILIKGLPDNAVETQRNNNQALSQATNWLVNWTEKIAKNNELAYEDVVTTISTLLETHPWCICDMIIAEMAKETSKFGKKAYVVSFDDDVLEIWTKDIKNDPTAFATREEAEKALEEIRPFLKLIHEGKI